MWFGQKLSLLWPIKDGHSANMYLAPVVADVNQNKIYYTSKFASFQGEQTGFYEIQFHQGVEELPTKNGKVVIFKTPNFINL